jgi:hypothetical protein
MRLADFNLKEQTPMHRFISSPTSSNAAHALRIALAFLITIGMAGPLQAQTALGTGINFSRSGLKLDNTLLNGTFDVRFKIFDAATGGTQVGPTLTKTGVAIAGGKLPTLALDFGNNVFDGEARWIEVRARQGGNPFAPTAPRQRLRPVPFALALPGLYTQQNDSCPNIIGGFAGNVVSPDFVGQTISGGGGETVENSVTGAYGTIAGGRANSAGPFATVSGGIDNSAGGSLATIGGGTLNQASGDHTTIGGGISNIASVDKATVGGGAQNTASGTFSSVGGGALNVASGAHSTVAGGEVNIASGTRSIVPGGRLNTASGGFSFAAGHRAKADADGSFVWGDSTNVDIFSGGTNTFNVRASGGTAFYSNAAATTGVLLAPGGGSWSGFSDGAGKSNIQPVNPRIALQKVVGLPISTWNYNAQDESIRHIGPMAQDFHAAFSVGEDDKHITTIDADGVALAAIQGLHQLIVEKDVQISDLNARIARLEALLNAPSNSNEEKP